MTNDEIYNFFDKLKDNCSKQRLCAVCPLYTFPLVRGTHCLMASLGGEICVEPEKYNLEAIWEIIKK